MIDRLVFSHVQVVKPLTESLSSAAAKVIGLQAAVAEGAHHQRPEKSRLSLVEPTGRTA